MMAGILVVLAGGGAFAYSQMHSATPQTGAAPLAVPESVVVHDTVRERTRVVDTLRLPGASRVDTVRELLPVTTAAATGGAVVTPPAAPPPAVSAPPATNAGAASANNVATGRGHILAPVSATGAAPAPAGSGFIQVNHPMLLSGQVRVDNTTTIVGPAAVIIAVRPGAHVVTFAAGDTPAFPAQWAPRVKAGDTVRVSFVPATGGGARGDSLRARIADQQARNAAQRAGRGGRRGGGG
jgi:hypothetical protein